MTSRGFFLCRCYQFDNTKYLSNFSETLFRPPSAIPRFYDTCRILGSFDLHFGGFWLEFRSKWKFWIFESFNSFSVCWIEWNFVPTFGVIRFQTVPVLKATRLQSARIFHVFRHAEGLWPFSGQSEMTQRPHD